MNNSSLKDFAFISVIEDTKQNKKVGFLLNINSVKESTF